MTDKVVSAVDLQAAYRDVFTSQNGQIVLGDLLRRFAYTSRTTIDADPYRTYAREGQRSVIIHIGRVMDGRIGDPTQTEAEYD